MFELRSGPCKHEASGHPDCDIDEPGSGFSISRYRMFPAGFKFAQAKTAGNRTFEIEGEPNRVTRYIRGLGALPFNEGVIFQERNDAPRIYVPPTQSGLNFRNLYFAVYFRGIDFDPAAIVSAERAGFLIAKTMLDSFHDCRVVRS